VNCTKAIETQIYGFKLLDPNLINSIKNPTGLGKNMVLIVVMEIHHLESLFKDPTGARIEEVLNVVSLFPRMVNTNLCDHI